MHNTKENHQTTKGKTSSPKIHMAHQQIQNCQSNSKEKKQSRRHNPPVSQTSNILESCYNQNSMAVAQSQTYGSMEQNTESPEIIPHTDDKLIFDRGGKNIKWRRDSLFSKWC